MELGTQNWSMKVLNRVPVIASSRKQDALRRLFSERPSPQAKAAIAKRFKRLRKKVLLTQAQLGIFIGLSRQSVSRIESCRAFPHFTTLNRFSEFESRHNQPRICLPRHWP
jgi:DNA-binding XRE family transcriptional regulator